MRGAVLLLLVLAAAGCSRSYYRQWADRETYPILDERVLSPAYTIGRTRLDPAPGSRLADPFDADHPPKPPDDPAAAVFMANPGGMRGARGWGKDGYTDRIEGPGWENVLGLGPNGTLKLDQDRAVELALLDSREYQTTLENVYLSALALTLNRFEFDVQWFGRNNTTYTHSGYSSVPGETNTLTSNSDLGFNRTFAAGGQLMADIANALTYEYTGHHGHGVHSNIALSLVQPLLRNAGRRYRLETLTQAERDVLYAVRDFARFRKSFWAGIAIGAGSAGAGGSVAGGPGVGGGSGSYLDLMLVVQQLRNSRANLKQQEETYRLYVELFRGGRASVVELDQFYQSYQSARLGVINSEVALQNALDAFKLRLGLPPRIPAELDESFLERFVLTDPALDRLHDELEGFQRERLAELDEPPPAEALRGHFDTLRRMTDAIPGLMAKPAADLARWAAQVGKPPRPDDDPEQSERARSAFETLRDSLPDVQANLARLAAAIDRDRAAVTEKTRKESWERLAEDVKVAIAQVDTVLAVQTQARIYLIELPDVEVREADALAYAKQNRLDLQNQLGQVTDAWRKVWVAANQLRGQFNIVANANLATDPDHPNPVRFSADSSVYSVGFQIDTPLNRMAERNAYRASLITYQRAKRSYVALSDSIEQELRRDIRTLRQLRLGFEISRQQLIAAARQYENARLQLLRPAGAAGAGGAGGTGGGTTLLLQQALAQLLSARNALAGNFINYEQQRVQLLLDLEALQMDARGFPVNASPTPPGPPPGPDAGRPAPGVERLPEPRPVPGPAGAVPPAAP